MSSVDLDVIEAAAKAALAAGTEGLTPEMYRFAQAANPAAVLALVDALRAAVAERDAARAALSRAASTLDQIAGICGLESRAMAEMGSQAARKALEGGGDGR